MRGLCHARGKILKLTPGEKLARVYDRRYKVPAIPGTTAKVCSKCSQWFASGQRERNCFGCSDPQERRKRLTQAITRGGFNEGTQPQVRRGRKTTSDPLSLCRELALEAALDIDFPGLRRRVTVLETPVRPERRCPLAGVTDPALIRSHGRAVAEGRQGCICGGGA